MSLFRREHVFVSVELDRVALVRLGANGDVREQAVIPVALDPARPAENLKAIEDALAAPAWRGAPCNVVLSDRLVHYVVIERPEGVRSSKELRLACEARFQSSFGHPAGEWEIAIDLRPFARRYFACGIARGFVDALRATFAVEGKLASLRPFLVCELQRRARRLPAECWFVAAAHDCITLVGIAAGECRLARVLAVEDPTIATIQDALNREMLLSGEIASDAPALCAGALQGDLGQTAMRRLDAPSWGSRPSSWARGYRLALAERWA